MWISKLAYLTNIFSRLNDLNSSLQGYCINIFSVCNITNGFKEVVKKKYENELRNQSLLLRGMMPNFSSIELRQSSEKTKQEKIRIPRCNFFGNWNCNQKSIISNLNRSSKDGKYRH